MTLPNDQATVVQKVGDLVPVLKNLHLAELQTSVEHLEWNAKKVQGGVPNENLLPTDWAKDTKFDLANVAQRIQDQSLRAQIEAITQEIDQRFPQSQDPAQVKAAASNVSQPVAPQQVPESSVSPPKETGMTAAGLRTYLSDLAAHRGEALDWEHSIVDLLKTLGLDDGVESRKRVAKTIGWQEDRISTIGSAEGNLALHHAILEYLPAHNGKLG